MNKFDGASGFGGKRPHLSVKEPGTISQPPMALSRVGLSPVLIWACIGALLLLTEFYFGIKWIAGDSFVAVPSGPDLPPVWMRWALDIGQTIMTLAWCGVFSWFVVHPWLNERRLTLDGLIVVGCTLASLWDALSNTGQFWFTYNAYLVNRGSVLDVLPTTLSPRTPGATEAWPMLFIDTLYGNFVFVTIIMCALMRYLKAQFPQLGIAPMIALCFLLGALADFIIEGVVLLPLGFWSYAGGHWAINAQTYYKFPLQEGICAGSVFASLTCLRFFVDDQGQTFVERGLDKIPGPPLKKSLVRACAVLGAVISIFIFFYHLPQGFLALHSTAWPDDVIKRSYLTDRICGPQVNLACPGPTTPIARQGSPRQDMAGHFPQ